MNRLAFSLRGPLSLFAAVLALTACSPEPASAPAESAAPDSPAAPAAAPADDPMAALRSSAPEGAALYFIEPADGATVSSPVTVIFGLSGMGVAPAGQDIEYTGHHHLLINEPEVDNTQPLPATEQIRHFGGGQTEASVELPAGTHRLQLVLGNHLHIPHDPPVVSSTITITVAP